MKLTGPLAKCIVTYSVIFCVDRSVWSEVSLGLSDLWLGLRGSKKSRIQSIHSQKEPYVASGWIEDFFGAFETSHLGIRAWISLGIQLLHQRGNPGAAATSAMQKFQASLPLPETLCKNLNQRDQYGSCTGFQWLPVG